MKLDIQYFADGKVVIDTELNTKNFENGLNKMKTSSEKAGSSIKSIVAGLGITKLISGAISTINSSLDGAISRLDTLNNFPKVMSNLGISDKDAEKSISKMSDKLSGLPTTLDQGAAAVQRFTSSNGDVKKSTDIFLALNNAILAGGASSEIQESALEQLSQAYAKGKPDMMEWRTAMTAMPAQLKQVAQAMGYVSADDLGEALRNGTVSMDEFMDTVSKLNTEGVNGFQSFEDQARNATGGIGTAITVAKTQVVKGVADMIDGLNKGLADANLPSISEIIAKIGKKAKEVLDKIASKLPDLIKFIVKIAPILEPIAATIIAIITAYKTYNAVVKIATAVQAGLNAVMAMNPIGLIALAIIGLVAAFVVLWKKCEGFRNFWIGLWDGIKNIFKTVWDAIGKFFTETIPNAFQRLKDRLAEIGNSIATFFQNLWNGIVSFFTETIPQWIQNVINWFANLPYMIGYHIGQILGNIIKFGQNVWNWITNDLPQIIQEIIKWFSELPEKIWNWLVNAVNNIITWGKNIKDAAVAKVSEMINAVVEWFKSLPSKILIWLQNTISKVATFAKDMATKGKEGAKNLFNNIVNTLKELPSKMLSLGKNIVEGIWNGIKNAKDWLINKIKDFAKGITDGIKKALGIHSPSTVMRDQVGKYVAQGIGVGFTEELNDVYRNMQHAINLEQAKLQANVETGSVFNTLNNSTPIQINLNADVEMDSTKVGRLITPSISETLKTGGIR